MYAIVMATYALLHSEHRAKSLSCVCPQACACVHLRVHSCVYLCVCEWMFSWPLSYFWSSSPPHVSLNSPTHPSLLSLHSFIICLPDHILTIFCQNLTHYLNSLSHIINSWMLQSGREEEEEAQKIKLYSACCSSLYAVVDLLQSMYTHTRARTHTHNPTGKIAWTPKCQGHPQSSKTITLFLNQSSNESW